MLIAALIVIVPLFIYCSYLFARDIKSSYSMYKFKRNRLKSGNNSKSWKPTLIEEIKVEENKFLSSVSAPRTPETKSAQQLKAAEKENLEKPVIKLYKDSLIKEVDDMLNPVNKQLSC